MKKNEFIPLEIDEQATFVTWLEMKGLKFTAIPNSTYTPSFKQKRQNYVMGLRPGLPDLLIAIPNDCLIFIEMKRLKGSKTSLEQKGWVEILDSIDNVAAHICNGAAHAIETVEKYISS